jgi:hypothetical protein
VGKFLFMISKVLRKMEKYEECEKVLKKALEYVWYARRQMGVGEVERGNKEQNRERDYRESNKERDNKEQNK